MMKRHMFLRMGIGVLFTFVILCGSAVAKETYVVQRGDTLTRIASKTGATVSALKAANRLKSNRLQIRQVLVIPAEPIHKTVKSNPSPVVRAEKYVVQKGDTLFRIARKTGISVAGLRELNRMQGSALKVGQKLVLSENPKQVIAAAEPPTYAKAEMEPGAELEEEEVDTLLTPEEAWAEIEKRKTEKSDLLGRWNHPEEPKLLVKVALGFLGAPYRLGGSSVTGIDCSGFVKKIYQFFDVELPRTAFEQSHVGLRIDRDDLAEGDLLFFNTRRPVGHVGIYIGDNKFVHAASRKRGVRVDNLDTPYFKKRFFRAVRLKGDHGGS